MTSTGSSSVGRSGTHRMPRHANACSNWFRRSWRRLALSATLLIVLGALLLPYALGLVPIANRPSFQRRGPRAWTVEKYDKAITELEPLVEQYPDSALAMLVSRPGQGNRLERDA